MCERPRKPSEANAPLPHEFFNEFQMGNPSGISCGMDESAPPNSTERVHQRGI